MFTLELNGKNNDHKHFRFIAIYWLNKKSKYDDKLNPGGHNCYDEYNSSSLRRFHTVSRINYSSSSAFGC